MDKVLALSGTAFLGEWQPCVSGPVMEPATTLGRNPCLLYGNSNALLVVLKINCYAPPLSRSAHAAVTRTSYLYEYLPVGWFETNGERKIRVK